MICCSITPSNNHFNSLEKHNYINPEYIFLFLSFKSSPCGSKNYSFLEYCSIFCGEAFPNSQGVHWSGKKVPQPKEKVCQGIQMSQGNVTS